MRCSVIKSFLSFVTSVTTMTVTPSIFWSACMSDMRMFSRLTSLFSPSRIMAVHA